MLAEDEVIALYLSLRLGFQGWTPPAFYASLPLSQYGIRLDDPAWISFLHRKNVRVFYWTVNDAHRMKELIARGADGIVTDNPHTLIPQ